MTATENITLDSVVAQPDGYVAADLDGEIVLMSIEDGTYFGFDKILSQIWEYMETPISVADLVDKLLEKYDVERERCESDVLKVLNDMSGDQLLSVR